MPSQFKPTSEQEAIIDHELPGHARVLAGPGTGKSATLVALVNRLLSKESPPRLRLLTFTRAATAELAEKVAMHPAAATQRPSTIHSFAISVLLKNPGVGGFPEPLRLADDWEKENLVDATLARAVGVRKDRLQVLIREMASNWEALEERTDRRVTATERSRFISAWKEHRQIYGYTLLAELPYALRNALRDHPDLEGIDYDLLVVDEYQDLNSCDLEVLRRLAERGMSIIAAGDDDQSIYGFRYAAPEGIRRFMDDYPGAHHYPLSVTQRCGKRIIEWAQYVIDGDAERSKDKAPLTCATGAPDGEVALLSFPSEKAEARGVATLIQSLLTRGLKPGDILVLFRADHNEAFSRPLKAQLDTYGIPYADPNTLKKMLAERANRFLLALLRLLVNRNDSLGWATLLHLSHGIGTSFFDHIYASAKIERTTFGHVLLAERAGEFAGAPRVSARAAGRMVTATISWLDTITVPTSTPEGGWGAWILSLTLPSEMTSTLTDSLKALFNDVDAIAESEQTLGAYLNQLAPLGKDLASTKEAGVRMMSMQAAKGLTVRATIMVGMEEGVMPRPDCPLSEEHRLLYVAMTRAKEWLIGTWARWRRGPTARSGQASVARRRSHSSFLEGGPVESEDGPSYISRLSEDGGVEG